jgi:hypothetical protein
MAEIDKLQQKNPPSLLPSYRLNVLMVSAHGSLQSFETHTMRQYTFM